MNAASVEATTSLRRWRTGAENDVVGALETTPEASRAGERRRGRASGMSMDDVHNERAEVPDDEQGLFDDEQDERATTTSWG